MQKHLKCFMSVGRMKYVNGMFVRNADAGKIIGNMTLKFGGIMKSVGLEYLLIRQEI